MSHGIWCYMTNHQNHPNYHGTPIANATLNHIYIERDKWQHLDWREEIIKVFEITNQLNKIISKLHTLSRLLCWMNERYVHI